MENSNVSEFDKSLDGTRIAGENKISSIRFSNSNFNLPEFAEIQL